MRRLLLILPVLAISWWVVQPSAGSISLSRCEPDGIFAKASAWVYGPAFWQAQMPYLHEFSARAQEWDKYVDKSKAQVRSVVDSAKARLDAMYEKYPQLAPSAATLHAEHLRATASAIEEAESDQLVSDHVHKQAALAQACEAKILAMR